MTDKQKIESNTSGKIMSREGCTVACLVCATNAKERFISVRLQTKIYSQLIVTVIANKKLRH